MSLPRELYREIIEFAAGDPATYANINKSCRDFNEISAELWTQDEAMKYFSELIVNATDFTVERYFILPNGMKHGIASIYFCAGFPNEYPVMYKIFYFDRDLFGNISRIKCTLIDEHTIKIDDGTGNITIIEFPRVWFNNEEIPIVDLPIYLKNSINGFSRCQN